MCVRSQVTRPIPSIRGEIYSKGKNGRTYLSPNGDHVMGQLLPQPIFLSRLAIDPKRPGKKKRGEIEEMGGRIRALPFLGTLPGSIL